MWLGFFISLVFLVDVKHTRYKLIGMNLSLIALTGLWFWRDIVHIKKIIKDTVLIPLIVFVGIFFVYYVTSDSPPAAHSQWMRVLFSGLAFFTAYMVMPDRYKKFLLNFLLITGGLLSLYGILQRSGGVGIIQVPQMARPFATFGNPNFFASFLIGLIPLGIASFWQKKRFWKVILIIINLIALYYTATRGAWAGLIGAGFFWWLFWGRKKMPIPITVLFFILIVVFIFATRNIWVRDLDRRLIWRDTLKMAVRNPVFGIGLNEFHKEFPRFASEELLERYPRGKFIVNYAHNEFLEMFAEVGIVGFGVYLWFLAVFYYIAVYKIPKNIITTGAICGATAILLHSGACVNMRFAVSSIWAFFLLGFSLAKVSTGGFPLEYKKVGLTVLFFVLLFFPAKSVLEPLISHRKLASEVDFFDSQREYNESELKELIKKHPSNAILYYKLGWIQAKNKEFPQAIENFKKTISLDATRVGAYNNLGNIYYTMGNRRLAEKYYKEAIARNPNLSDARFNLGYIYYHQGKLKEASEQFNEVIRLDKDNFKAKIMLEKMVQ